MTGPEQASLFFSLLTVIAQVGVALWIGLCVAARISPAAVSARFRVAKMVGPSALWLGVLVTGTCMAGSLYFSEIANFPPCKLCWYQRICMFSLVPILLVAALRRDRNVWPYAATLSAIGAPISAYHYLHERFPTVIETGACDPANPCSVVWFFRFHYISLPMMALTGFLATLTLLSVYKTSEKIDG